MATKRKRLTETMGDFVEAVFSAGKDVARKVIAALEAGLEPISEGVNRVVEGKEVPRYSVRVRGLKEAAGDALHRACDTLTDHLEDEAQFRGRAWTNEGMHLAVREHLIEPLRAGLDVATPSPLADAPIGTRTERKATRERAARGKR